MLILSEDSFTMLVTGSGTVVIHPEQFHEKLVFEEASLVYSVAVTLPHSMWHQQRQRLHRIARWLLATLLRQTENKFLLKLLRTKSVPCVCVCESGCYTRLFH